MARAPEKLKKVSTKGKNENWEKNVVRAKRPSQEKKKLGGKGGKKGKTKTFDIWELGTGE